MKNIKFITTFILLLPGLYQLYYKQYSRIFYLPLIFVIALFIGRAISLNNYLLYLMCFLMLLFFFIQVKKDMFFYKNIQSLAHVNIIFYCLLILLSIILSLISLSAVFNLFIAVGWIKII